MGSIRAKLLKIEPGNKKTNFIHEEHEKEFKRGCQMYSRIAHNMFCFHFNKSVHRDKSGSGFDFK